MDRLRDTRTPETVSITSAITVRRSLLLFLWSVKSLCGDKPVVNRHALGRARQVNETRTAEAPTAKLRDPNCPAVGSRRGA
jgi:hypothetical protein